MTTFALVTGLIIGFVALVGILFGGFEDDPYASDWQDSDIDQREESDALAYIAREDK